MLDRLSDSKVRRFGLIGAVGCLLGWIAGEPYLLVTKLAAGEASRAPSLTGRPEPAPPPPELKSRLDAAGARTGEIQVSLAWNNTNDLDLHCKEPSGFEICFPERLRRSPSGGHLDVDQNADCQRSVTNPVENVYWPKGAAAAGEYQVIVEHYKACGPQVATNFHVSVLVGAERREFDGSVDRAKDRVTVHTFRVAPAVEVYPATASINVRSGSETRLPVQVERRFCKGPVTLRAEGLPAGMTAAPLVIPDESDSGELVLTATGSAGTAPPVRLTATCGAATGFAEVAIACPEWWSWWTLFVTAGWTALLAIGLTASLVAAQNQQLGRPAADRVVSAAGGAAVVGLASGGIGQALQFLAIAAGLPWGLGFFTGWVLLGGLVGTGVSRLIPNLARDKAALAGAVGGALGAIGFLMAAFVADVAGRVVGAAVLGACIGAMVAVAEVAFRRAWLEIQHGEREVVSVSLGPEPVTIGSGRGCTVWARAAPELALRYFIRAGTVIRHDALVNKEGSASDGATEEVGGVRIRVRMANTAAPVVLVARPPAPVMPSPAVAQPKPPADPSRCPGCGGRLPPGRPGTRYCIVCDQTV